MQKLQLTTTIDINAPAANVWKGLTDTELVRRYFFGTTVKSDWTKGSPITFTGEWNGKSYEDKGTIIEITPGEYVKYSYWSSMSGTEDKPDNYANVSYRVAENNGITTLEVTQDNIKDEAAKEHSEKSWQAMFGGLKQLLEQQVD
ncbi:SRPBCC domain-containing protein [Mucilaginibacter sp.]|uniref:SRPBCC family protein n=1 Tax=Mucilaginibacter sp. TaxID=1882438 RepID=UPI0035BC166B